MRTRVSKWGNSLAVRIPAALADEVRLSCGDSVELQVVDGALTLSTSRRVPTLEEMLASVRPGETHGEVDWGKPVGNEIW